MKNLFFFLVENNCTVYDLEYAAKNIPRREKVISLMQEKMYRKIATAYINGDRMQNYKVVRDIYGSDHAKVKALDRLLLSEHGTTSLELYNYMFGTIEGSRIAVGWFLGNMYLSESNMTHLKRGIDNGNMLDLAIEYCSDDPEFIQRIKERIDGGD